MVSAPPCHGGGRGFKSRRGRSGRVSSDDYSSEDAVIAYLKVNTQGSVAQLVERTTENRKVTGSTPVGATKSASRLLQWGGFCFKNFAVADTAKPRKGGILGIKPRGTAFLYTDCIQRRLSYSHCRKYHRTHDRPKFSRTKFNSPTPRGLTPNSLGKKATTGSTQAGGICFENITKSYPSRTGGSTTVLQNLNLHIPAGQITVFVGPSGCGKTTSLRMINRMVEPNSGTITIDGVNVHEKNPYELRRGIGYVMQQGGLMPHRTVAQNIATVPRLLGASRKEAQARALELLNVVGLDSSYAKRYPSQLSGGQVQRVGVARALAADAPVLLMDEPFSAVDPVVRTDLQKELLRLQGELAKTIVFVTHDIDEALLLGDTIAVFAEGGRLAQFGTPEEILYSPADDFVRSFVSRSVAGLLDEQTVRQARACRLATFREAQNSAVEGEKSE